MKKLKIILLACVLTGCATKVPVNEKPANPTEQKKESRPVLRQVAIIVLTSVIRALIR